MIQAPCQGCGDRRVGCHDPAVCARWAAFLARRDAARAAAPSPEETVMLAHYLKDRSRRHRPKDWRRKRHF